LPEPRWSECSNCCATPSCLSRPELSLLEDIGAASRPTGSATNRGARLRVGRELGLLGFTLREQRFEFSKFPGKYATPLFGASALILVGAAARLAVTAAAPPFVPAVVLAGGALLLTVVGRWLSRSGVLRTPLLRETGVNLVATRGDRMPRVWLCAHLDTKSQPVPTLVRGAAILVESVGYLIALAVALLVVAGRAPHPIWWIIAGGVTLLGAVPVMLCVVTDNSPGALDNASGLATVLATAAALPRDANFGVVITDAEELGLAGARAWAAQAHRGSLVVNCDGVDDHGPIVVTYSGKEPPELLKAVHVACRNAGVSCQTSRLVPGLLTDSVAFTDAGMESVTFMRGNWRSLARVHSRRDSLRRLRGTGIADTASLMSHTVFVLRGVLS